MHQNMLTSIPHHHHHHHPPPPPLTCSLLAEDVMSDQINFLYPITRVGSVYQLLKSTHHSAFPVVTPLDDFARPSSNVSDKHTPALYGVNKPATGPVEESTQSTQGSNQVPKRYQRRTVRNATKATPVYRRTTFKPRGDKGGKNQPVSAELNDESGFNFAYPIPSSGAELQTSKVELEKPLILHGFILRSQLLTLLRYKVFFSEEEQVGVLHLESLRVDIAHVHYGAFFFFFFWGAGNGYTQPPAISFHPWKC